MCSLFLPEIKNKITFIRNRFYNMLYEIPIYYYYFPYFLFWLHQCSVQLSDLMKTNKPTETTVVISYFLGYFSPVYSSEYNFISPTILYTLVYNHVYWYLASRRTSTVLRYMFLFYFRKLSYSIILSVKNWNTKYIHGRGSKFVLFRSSTCFWVYFISYEFTTLIWINSC